MTDPYRGSCLCGVVNFEPEDEVEIALGAMDEDVPVEPSAHIFVGSAANWAVLSDD